MKKETTVTRTGNIVKNNEGCVNTPVYRSSTILFPTLDDYKRAESGKAFYASSQDIRAKDFAYSTSGTPTTHALQRAIAEIENTEFALISPSGLAAITHTMLSFLKPSDHILVTDSVYGPARRFCNKVLRSLNVEVTFYDPLIGSNIKDLFKENTKMVFVESPGSLTFDIQDIPAIAKEAHKKGIVVAADNSWATPLNCKPKELGADIIIEAATKYIGGHSDILLGTVAADKKYFDPIYDTHHYFGSATSPDDCYLALRGLRTISPRLKSHQQNAQAVIDFLKTRPEIEVILNPTIETHPNHNIFRRDFNGSNGLISIILKDHYDYDNLCNMVNNYQIFKIGASWGGFESLVLQFDPKSVRTATKWNYKGLCLRFHIGLENIDDIIKDLEDGFLRLSM